MILYQYFSQFVTRYELNEVSHEYTINIQHLGISHSTTLFRSDKNVRSMNLATNT